jgi:hypothetical protein
MLTRSGFFRQANGEPVIYNGLYSTCINGGYYRAQAVKILTEALDKYEVDGLFFNMFGNQSRDYSGREVGLCHCDACRTRYRAMFHKDVRAQLAPRSTRSGRVLVTSTTFRNRPTASCRNRTPHWIGLCHCGPTRQRQRQPCAQQRAGQDGSEPEHAVRYAGLAGSPGSRSGEACFSGSERESDGGAVFRRLS